MEQVIMKTPDDVEALVKDAFPPNSGGFRPCAFLDDRLDCIRVIARDCSVCEERVTDRLTVLVDNYPHPPERKKYVGFTIKGARHFCQEHGLRLGTSLKMTELLDAVLASSPEPAVMFFVDLIGRPLVEEGNIEVVEIPEFQAA
jgi:hypothetical protein